MEPIKLDFQQFERQRLTLFKEVGELYEKSEHIQGIIHLLDAISDANQLSGGEPVVIYPTHQYPNADTIEILHEHDYDRCIPLFTPGEHKGVAAAIWDCSDFIEKNTNE